MTTIVTVEKVRFLPSAGRTTWRVELACGASYTVDRWGKDRPVIGEAVTCGCAVCSGSAVTL